MTELSTLLPRICQCLEQEIHKLGFLSGVVAPSYADSATPERVKDTYTGAENCRVVLYGAQGKALGQIQFNSDDSFYAEYDVLQYHPRDPRWFVEAVVAWGRGDAVKSEPKLLRLPE